MAEILPSYYSRGDRISIGPQLISLFLSKRKVNYDTKMHTITIAMNHVNNRYNVRTMNIEAFYPIMFTERQSLYSPQLKQLGMNILNHTSAYGVHMWRSAVGSDKPNVTNLSGTILNAQCYYAH